MNTLPNDFVEQMKKIKDLDLDAFLLSFQEKEVHSLRFNPLKMKEIRKELKEKLPKLEPVEWEPWGYYYEETEDYRPGKSPFHEAGAYYIQEASAMISAALLKPVPGEKILDLCAAPGGKSTQISAYLQNEGLLVSNEIIGKRADILSENVERFGIRNALVTNHDSKTLTDTFPLFFDGIMVDAPCSGEGMFRKNKEAVSEWSPENVENCMERQREILTNAYQMLRSGGRMVYSTCTFEKGEDEDMISWFIQEFPDMKLLHMKRIWPHLDRGEGHFAALLSKGECSPSQNTSDKANRSGKQSPKLAEACRLWQEFAKEELSDEFTKVLSTRKEILFGEQLYLLPPGISSVSGLKVKRPGLHVGTVKNGRFEPAHALALTLSKEDAKKFVDLSYEDAIKYIEGYGFPCEKEKGWILVTVSGISLGWGKAAGGMVKNHYPKGLRKLL